MQVSPAPGGLSHWPRRQRHCVMVDSLHPLNGKPLGGWGSGRSQMCADGCGPEEGVDALPPAATRCGTYSVIYYQKCLFIWKPPPSRAEGWTSGARRRFLWGKSSEKVNLCCFFLSLFFPSLILFLQLWLLLKPTLTPELCKISLSAVFF